MALAKELRVAAISEKASIETGRMELVFPGLADKIAELETKRADILATAGRQQVVEDGEAHEKEIVCM
jgi:hypothetical protein